MTTITIAMVLARIDEQLEWRGSHGPMEYIALKREYAEYLRQWAITLCKERDELVAEKEGHANRDDTDQA